MISKIPVGCSNAGATSSNIVVEHLLIQQRWSVISTHVCSTFFVGRMFDKVSNDSSKKNVNKNGANAPILSDQQMLYNNVGACSPAYN